jgi:hypothetical protein
MPWEAREGMGSEKPQRVWHGIVLRPESDVMLLRQSSL